MLNSTKQTKPNLKETFAGLIYDIFRAAGLSINQTNQERVEQIAPRFSDAIKQEARDAALVLAKRLQEATINGFENFGKLLDEQNAKIAALEEEVKKLQSKKHDIRYHGSP